ncbi:MAG TPA: matrixin family metalloprotease [Thermoanaerobaculia bacterium]|nr:matrixin family metalloprotease [Thermoanaerobaculia bacterium]
MRKLLALGVLAAVAAFGAAPAQAGGALETYDITGAVPTPIAGHVEARMTEQLWDARCIPVQYSLNDTLDPIPNPFGAPVISLAQAGAALQKSFDSWNDIPTSFIDLQITATTSNPGTRRFDMVNELTFRTAPTFGAIASSPSVSLIQDALLSPGIDIDGDGDSDVSASIALCADVDGDGDIEFPAGIYRAGTILDNDVQFGSAFYRFTVLDAHADLATASVDLETVAVHEFGHSHGLSHVLNNQKSDTDGRGATMYPFIDTGDPVSELTQRALDSDDIAFSSFYYPEGTAASGPAALQAGDVAFDAVYSTIEGTVTHGVTGLPVAGASVEAFDNGSLTVAAFSGTTRLSLAPTGGLFVISADWNVVDGRYVIPVPRGHYTVGIQAVNNADEPVGPTRVNFTTQIGSIFGQNDFEEEFYQRGQEGAIEKEIGKAGPVPAMVPHARSSKNIDFVTNVTARLADFGSQDFIGFTLPTPGLYYAVRFPQASVAAALDGNLLQAALFRTTLLDSSEVPLWSEAALVSGVVNPDGTATLDLANPIVSRAPFVSQENDFAPLFFDNPRQLSAALQEAIALGQVDDLWLVLRAPFEPFPGPSQRAPAIGLDGVPGGVNDVPIAGNSYTSANGGASFSLDPRFNFMFAMLFSPAP